MVVSRSGGYSSESSVLGTIPDMFSRHSELAMTRSPPAFVPEYPSPFRSARTLVITA
jgi:hypothetical protein